MEIVQYVLANWEMMAGLALGLLVAILAILKAIPEVQPGETLLEKAVALLKKALGKQ